MGQRDSLLAFVDPKPENETKGKLMVWPWCGSLNDRGRRTDATERAQRREDRIRVAAGGSRQKGERGLPRNGCFAAGVLQLEATLRRTGIERTSRATPVARREQEAEDDGRGSQLGQAHSAGSALKKSLKPAARR